MTLQEVLTAAIKEITEKGFTAERMAFWQEKLRTAAYQNMGPMSQAEANLKAAMRAVYEKMIECGGILTHHPGVGRFTVQRLKPRLRIELDKRIFASADLIRLNREQSVAKTLQRLSGWATSIPSDGSDIVEKTKVKTGIRKAMSQLPFEERRVIVDQSHKLASSLNNVIAMDGGAIAAIWHHHYKTYPRPVHVARDGKIYLIRDSWAHAGGLVKPGAYGYTDQITQPAEEPLCGCTYQYIYNLRSLPDDMITAKGHEQQERVRLEVAKMRAA